MKNILIIALAMMCYVANATESKYVEMMLKNIEAINNSKTVEDYQKVVNTLDRIGAAEADKWEPHYYGAYGNILMSTRVGELAEKDQYLDQAQLRLDKAVAIDDNNVELVTLQGFIHMMRLAAEPATRGQQYAGLAFEHFNKAVSMDEHNPRALIMRAQMKQGTAKFFGTSTDEACGEAVRALELIDQQDTSVPSIAPSWGRWNAEGMVKQCSASEKVKE
jgi:hypothetical protein